jgi:glycosyltransferase involved in cell wall biosynthesis
MKISIIVPVYNVEAYLGNCLKSLLEQDLPPTDYEIIMVDDGSPDGSAKIIERYSENHPNIILIRQQNGGVSAARNAGIDAAKGKYIFFVDADDAIYPNVLKTLCDRAEQDSLDLLYVKMEYFGTDGKYQGEFAMDSPKIEILDGFSHQRRGFIASIYRTETIGDIRFVTGIPIGEDAIFNIMVHTVAQRVTYLDIPVYKYTMRDESAVNSLSKYSEKVFAGYLKTLKVLKAYRDANLDRLDESQVKYFNRPFFKTIENALKTSIIPMLHRQRLKRLKDAIRENGLGHLTAQVAASVKYFDQHPIIFLGYYKVKRMIKKLRKR